jgi:hypothetical protein
MLYKNSYNLPRNHFFWLGGEGKIFLYVNLYVLFARPFSGEEDLFKHMVSFL